MPSPDQSRRWISRRELLCRGGLGTLALAGLLADEGHLFAEHDGQLDRVRPVGGSAQRVIFLMMAGAPGHMDTWDPKPELSKRDGQALPESVARQVESVKRVGWVGKLMGSPFPFARYGESGIPVSSLFPHTARHVDDLCVIRSLSHHVPVHGPAEYVTFTGSALGDRPSLGAWLIYGISSENQDLPGFIVSLSGGGPDPQPQGWAPGFLPARNQGTLVEASEGVPFVELPSGFAAGASRRDQLDLLAWLNHRDLRRRGVESELQARIESYELAFRMQTAAPEAFDLSAETRDTRRLYGIDQKTTAEFGRQCLLARRLVERGVRFVQLRNGGWDAHAKLKSNHLKQAAASDKPVAALLTDLKLRGLLDDTLVIWGGEFGRTPTMQEASLGRDHSPTAYTMWLAGGGIKGGQIIGNTDDFGLVVSEQPVSPNDFHATILHALGINQHRLFYLRNGRREIVTDLGGSVIEDAFSHAHTSES